MTLLVGTTDLEPGHVTAVTDASGQLVRSGTGFVAIGAFGDLDDETIRGAAASASDMQNVLGRFHQLGASNRFGLGPGLERIDGAFQTAVSAPTQAGDGWVGRPVYVVGATETGLFIYKSRLTFEADAPVACGQVDLWGDRETLAGGLLVGEVGDSLEVLELGPSDGSLRLASTGGQALDLSRFESTLVPRNDPPADPPPINIPPPPIPLPSQAVTDPEPSPPETFPPDPLPPSPTLGNEGRIPWAQAGEETPAVLNPYPHFLEFEVTWWAEGSGQDVLIQEWAQMEITSLQMSQSLNLRSTAAIADFQGTETSTLPFLPVPEPSSALLTCAAIASLLTRRRRSRPHHQ